jgi:type IV secretory pathway VirD2 relaxase
MKASRKPSHGSGQPDPYDRDRLGRMGSGRLGEPSIRSQLARRLGGFRGRNAPKARRNTGPNSGMSRLQRVVVKVHVSRHRPGKVHGSVLRHVSYIGRESASLDGQRGAFYDATQDGLDARQIVKAWEQDRHHFRLIVSPENAKDLPDMKVYIRTAMTRIERDLGTPLQWLAVNHFNTDNPHAHVLFRGIKADGMDLVIPRQYVSYGIRRRAQEAATEILGPRSADDIQREQDRQIEAERFTSLDRMIERNLQAGRIDLHPDQRIGFGPDDRIRILGRLQFLQTMDLAKKDKRTWWILDPDFGSKLRDLGQRNDIIKSLYATLGNQAGHVERLGGKDSLVQPIQGILIAKGNVDEISDRRFVVVRDQTGRLYYSQVSEDNNFHRAQRGAIVELGARAYRQGVLAREIVALAQRHDGIYSAAEHQALLLKNQPEIAPKQVYSRIRSATARLAFIAGHKGSGVERMDENTFRIDVPVFEQFSSSRRGKTDLRILASQGQSAQNTLFNHAQRLKPDREVQR